jgi:acetylornithine deacetylase/succinyl-diaminopimelate desuccinylase-like protein
LHIPRRRLPESTISLVQIIFTRYKFSDLIKLLSQKNPPSNPYEKDRRTYRSMFETSFSFDKIRAGEKVNIVPDRCELEVDFRVIPGVSAQDLFDALADYCTWLGYKVEVARRITRINRRIRPGFANEPVDVEISIITLSGKDSLLTLDLNLADCWEAHLKQCMKPCPVYTFRPGFRMHPICMPEG